MRQAEQTLSTPSDRATRGVERVLEPGDNILLKVQDRGIVAMEH